MTDQLPFHVYDVFTDRPFAGNPLAIVEGADALSTAQMQAMAREFNLSETIFVLPPEDPAHTARVRIFTPNHEMPFAGHPTVGCAIHLAGDSADEVTLEENAGLVPVTIRRSGAIHAEFTAPVSPDPRALDLDAASLAAALGLTEGDLGQHRPYVVHGGHPFVFVPVASLDALSRAGPSDGWRKLVEAAGTGSGYVYTEGADVDYESRMFAPDGGIVEDPATGSATSLLSGQLLANGGLSAGTNTLRLRQGRDMGRESHLDLSVDVAGGAITAVRVGGSAVKVSSGQIKLPA